MRVLCINDNARHLPQDYFEKGYTPSSTFDLACENEYVVYGISLWRSLLLYLLVGEGGRPAWYPAELFKITRKDIPPFWSFAFFGPKEVVELSALWGYDELVNTDEHFDELANLESKAVEIFQARRMQIDIVS